MSLIAHIESTPRGLLERESANCHWTAGEQDAGSENFPERLYAQVPELAAIRALRRKISSVGAQDCSGVGSPTSGSGFLSSSCGQIKHKKSSHARIRKERQRVDDLLKGSRAVVSDARIWDGAKRSLECLAQQLDIKEHATLSHHEESEFDLLETPALGVKMFLISLRESLNELYKIQGRSLDRIRQQDESREYSSRLSVNNHLAAILEQCERLYRESARLQSRVSRLVATRRRGYFARRTRRNSRSSDGSEGAPAPKSGLLTSVCSPLLDGQSLALSHTTTLTLSVSQSSSPSTPTSRSVAHLQWRRWNGVSSLQSGSPFTFDDATPRDLSLIDYPFDRRLQTVTRVADFPQRAYSPPRQTSRDLDVADMLVAMARESRHRFESKRKRDVLDVGMRAPPESRHGAISHNNYFELERLLPSIRAP